jgi:hypothetical protein
MSVFDQFVTILRLENLNNSHKTFRHGQERWTVRSIHAVSDERFETFAKSRSKTKESLYLNKIVLLVRNKIIVTNNFDTCSFNFINVLWVCSWSKFKSLQSSLSALKSKVQIYIRRKFYNSNFYRC